MASASLPRFQVRGIERFAIWTPETCFKVVHSMLLKENNAGSPTALDVFLRFLPAALMHTFNRHPRMRARLVADEFAVAEIHPKLTLQDIEALELLNIKSVPNMDAWQAFVQKEATVPFNRVACFGFVVHAWVDRAAGRVRLMLFSDHYVSDGASGNTILNDILSIASALARGNDISTLANELPLHGSLYEQSFNSRPWLHRVLRTAIGYAAQTLLKLTPRFEPLIKPRTGHSAFAVPPPINASTILFATGTRPGLEKLLARCREEKTTFFGALVASVIVAMASVADTREDGKLDVKLSLAYDMRSRMTDSVDPETVGFYALSGSIDTLMAGGGLAVADSRFWDVARAAKQEADKGQHSFALKYLGPVLLDQCYHSQTPASFFEQLPRNEYASVGDVSMSSVGRYKYSTSYTFSPGSSPEGADAALSVEALHFACRAPFIAALSQFYVTSVPNGIGFGFNHHLEESVGQQIFDAVVTVMENAWRVDGDASLLQATEQLLHNNTKERADSPKDPAVATAA